MEYERPFHTASSVPGLLYRILVAFPIATFSLSVLTDIAYWQTANLMWLHFSEWLLLTGLVFGFLAAAALIVGSVTGREAIIWPRAVSGAAVLVLAALNSFVHTADGWTAVMPYGLSISTATVILMVVTGWLGGWGDRS